MLILDMCSLSVLFRRRFLISLFVGLFFKKRQLDRRLQAGADIRSGYQEQIYYWESKSARRSVSRVLSLRLF